MDDVDRHSVAFLRVMAASSPREAYLEGWLERIQRMGVLWRVVAGVLAATIASAVMVQPTSMATEPMLSVARSLPFSVFSLFCALVSGSSLYFAKELLEERIESLDRRRALVLGVSFERFANAKAMASLDELDRRHAFEAAAAEASHIEDAISGAPSTPSRRGGRL
jgi:hypothetical protein